MKNNIILLLSIVVWISCGESKQKNGSRVDNLPYYNEATFTPHWIDPKDKSLDTFHKVSPFKLFNQAGEIITEKTFEGKIYVTDFFFTICPGICPKMTDNMMELQYEFLNDNDVLLLSHSVLPEADSIPVLESYAENKGIELKTWHLATGTQEEIYRLGRKDYFVEEDLGLEKEADEFLHTENFVLIDKKGHLRGIYNGLKKPDITRLITDIRTLKNES